MSEPWEGPAACFTICVYVRSQEVGETQLCAPFTIIKQK